MTRATSCLNRIERQTDRQTDRDRQRERERERNEPGRQKWKDQKCWQQAKLAMLYFDLLQTSKGGGGQGEVLYLFHSVLSDLYTFYFYRCYFELFNGLVLYLECGLWPREQANFPLPFYALITKTKFLFSLNFNNDDEAGGRGGGYSWYSTPGKPPNSHQGGSRSGRSQEAAEWDREEEGSVGGSRVGQGGRRQCRRQQSGTGRKKAV